MARDRTAELRAELVAALDGNARLVDAVMAVFTRRRNAEAGRLRAQLRTERTFTRTAQREAREAEVCRAKAEAEQARLNLHLAEARAHHVRNLNAALERAEAAEACLAEVGES